MVKISTWVTQKGWKFDADSLKRLLAFASPFPELEMKIIAPEMALNQMVEILTIYDLKCWIHILSLDLYTVCELSKLSDM